MDTRIMKTTSEIISARIEKNQKSSRSFRSLSFGLALAGLGVLTLLSLLSFLIAVPKEAMLIASVLFLIGTMYALLVAENKALDVAEDKLAQVGLSATDK